MPRRPVRRLEVAAERSSSARTRSSSTTSDSLGAQSSGRAPTVVADPAEAGRVTTSSGGRHRRGRGLEREGRRRTRGLMLTFAALAWWRWPRRRAGGRRCRPLGETSPGDAGIPVDRQAGGRLAPGRRRNGARRRLLGPRSRRLGRIRAGRDVHRSAVGGRLRGLDTGGERTSVEKEQGWPGPLGGRCQSGP
jgi:hypothetical protein